MDLNSVEAKPKKWIQDMTWLNLVELGLKMAQFRDLTKQVANNDKVTAVTCRLLGVLIRCINMLNIYSK